MSDFDAKARDWDKNQQYLERSEAVAAALLKMIPLHNGMRALEYGSGTALLSFLLRDRFAEITLMDNSKEMTQVTIEKIEAQNIQNMKPLFFDLEYEDYYDRFDIIYSQMVMHHVNNIETMLAKFNSLLFTGGYLAIADLYAEDGSFHGESFKGHLGFDIEELSMKLLNAGFRDISHQTCHIIRRLDETGSVKEFPIFLLIAQKK